MKDVYIELCYVMLGMVDANARTTFVLEDVQRSNSLSCKSEESNTTILPCAILGAGEVNFSLKRRRACACTESESDKSERI